MRKKETEKPEFSIDDRGFNVKVWYVEDSKDSKGDATVEIRHKGDLIREFIFPAYKIWNIAAHFTDIVDGELTKENKLSGYQMAAFTGFN